MEFREVFSGEGWGRGGQVGEYDEAGKFGERCFGGGIDDEDHFIAEGGEGERLAFF